MSYGLFVLQGIVGTSCGTLWYINWTERTSIRLVSGHSAKVRLHNHAPIVFYICLLFDTAV